MKSRKFCEKMMLLFGVESIEELKTIIQKCTHDSKMKYSGSWDVAPAILDCIKIDEIGSVF